MRLKLVTELQQSHLFACLLLPLLRTPCPLLSPVRALSQRGRGNAPGMFIKFRSVCRRVSRGKRDCPLFHNVTALFDSHMRSRSSFFGSFPYPHLMPSLNWFFFAGESLVSGRVCMVGVRAWHIRDEVFAPTSDLASRPCGRAVCSRVHGILPVLLRTLVKDLGTFF